MSLIINIFIIFIIILLLHSTNEDESSFPDSIWANSILVNDSKRIWDLIAGWTGPKRIDFVLDNAGPELFSDLCLAIWLTHSGLASEVHFHVKDFGWFVSDVTVKDFHWLLQRMTQVDQQAMNKLGQLAQKFLGEGRWILKSDPFWTCGEAFWETAAVAPSLYADLSASSLIFLKGTYCPMHLLAFFGDCGVSNFLVALQVT